MPHTMPRVRPARALAGGVRRDTLWLAVAGGAPTPLQPLFREAFSSEYGVVRFERDGRGRVTGLRLTGTDVRALRFARWSPPAIRLPTTETTRHRLR